MKRTIPLPAIAVIAFAASFEVASVKPSAPSDSFCRYLQNTPLQLSMQGCTLRDYVISAWSLEPFDLILPANAAWISSARYDIAAKSSAPVPLPELTHMLQPVLGSRFQMKFHHETRDLPVFYLSPVKSGLKLSATKPGSCTPWDKKGPPPPPRPDHAPTCDYILYPGSDGGLGFGIEGTGVPMASFVAHLSQLLERPVIDRTGYTGIFDVHLKFTRESVPRFANQSYFSGSRGNTTSSGAAEPDAAPTGLPSIFTAMKTLGISLESGKGPVDIVVVDSAQRPSEN
jgi:uncharacterized protein (TIGR03435 family)